MDLEPTLFEASLQDLHDNSCDLHLTEHKRGCLKVDKFNGSIPGCNVAEQGLNIARVNSKYYAGPVASHKEHMLSIHWYNIEVPNCDANDMKGGIKGKGGI
jgi:hypothetical protein